MKKIVRMILNNTFSKGSFLLTFASFVVYAFNYAFNFLVGHSLGPAGFGEITSLFSYQYISMVPVLVLTTMIIQKISNAENPYLVSKTIEYFFWQKIKKWWYVGFVGLAFLPFLPDLTNLSPIVAFSLFPFFILGFLTSFYTAALQGLHLFFAFSLVSITAAFIKLMGGIAVALHIGGITTIIIFLFTSSLYTLVESYKQCKRIINKNMLPINSELIKIDRRIVHIIKNRQFYFTLFLVFALSIFNNIDVIFARKFFSAFDAGIYSAWSLFAKIIWYALTPLLLVSFIFFSNQKKQVYHHQVFIGVLLFLCFVGVISYIGYIFFTPWLAVFLLGKKFTAVNPYLPQAALFGIFYTTITFVSNYFLAKKNSAALLIPILVCCYCLVLLIIPKNLLSMIRLNVIFSFVTVLIHLMVYTKQSFEK